MKRSLFPIAVAMVAALTVVSCKNNRKAQVQEPTQEEIQEQKQALADSVLSTIDNLVAKYQEASDKGDFSMSLVLTDEEKLVKPDYLLDPSLASTFVTRDQKITALGYYLIDYLVLCAYDMPLDASKVAIAKLAAEVNYPFDIDKMYDDFTIPISDIVKQEYNTCKERNDLAAFWRLEYSFHTEKEYILTNNPELFLGKITEEQHQAIAESWDYLNKAVACLAEYDSEMHDIMEFNNSFLDGMSGEELNSLHSTKEKAIDSYKKDILHNIESRNALLK